MHLAKSEMNTELLIITIINTQKCISPEQAIYFTRKIYYLQDSVPRFGTESKKHSHAHKGRSKC